MTEKKKKRFGEVMTKAERKFWKEFKKWMFDQLEKPTIIGDRRIGKRGVVSNLKPDPLD